MIKELLLSLAVAAASGVSFVGSPKKAQYPSAHFYTEIYYNTGEGGYCDIWYNNGEDSERLSQDDSKTLNVTGWGTCEVAFGYELPQNYDDCYIYFNIYPPFRPSVDWTCSNNAVTMSVEQDGSDYYIEFGLDGVDAFDWADRHERFTLECTVSEYVEPAYTLTKNFINCDISSSPVLPNTYTADNQLSYYVLMVSNAGGYGFTAQSVTQTGGITIRNFNLMDQYNNSGYYASCSFNVDLPLNSCSLTVEAFIPQYTITASLERCTVSPAIPSSYTGTNFSGDYTFTAVSGYGFNKNYTHWEVTNLFIDSVEFSSLLWGSFYSSVTLHLRASGGNSSISVTAIEYDEENYKLGYEEGREDGWQAGYDKGHADGEIAGNSYGVWNWLKQAALTTGEFLSINLLPGFSIGALLTALAGLMIIWLFIKGFLFKS